MTRVKGARRPRRCGDAGQTMRFRLLCAAVMLLFCHGVASACSCVEGTPTEENVARIFAWADLVFIGHVESIKEETKPDLLTVTTLAVKQRWKGAAVGTVEFAWDHTCCRCTHHFELGASYVVFAQLLQNGRYRTSTCVLTRKEADAAALMALLEQIADAE